MKIQALIVGHDGTSRRGESARNEGGVWANLAGMGLGFVAMKREFAACSWSSRIAAFVVLVGAVVPRSAGAQDVRAPAERDNRAEARAAFERGVAALDEGRSADAVTAFEESYRLREAATVLTNLGISYRAVGRVRDAISAFERYVAAPPQRATAGELANIRAEIERLRRSLGAVTIRVTPRESTVRIDGRLVQGVGPHEVDPGTRAVEISAPGYETERRELRLGAGARSEVRAELVRDTSGARLIVDPSVAGAAVTLDGEAAGNGHVERSVTVGTHRVMVRAAGYEPSERTVQVSTGGVTRVEVTLVAPRTGLPGWVVPVAIAGGVLVVGGVVGGIAWSATQPPEPLPERPGSWGMVLVNGP